jgi:hypothetical protein
MLMMMKFGFDAGAASAASADRQSRSNERSFFTGAGDDGCDAGKLKPWDYRTTSVK